MARQSTTHLQLDTSQTLPNLLDTIKTTTGRTGRTYNKGFGVILAGQCNISLVLLSAAYPADVILMGFYLLPSSFVILFNSSSGRTFFKFQKQRQALFVSWHFTRPFMNIETAYYIIHHFPRLLTKTENAALRHYNAMFKIGKPEKYSSVDTYNERLKWYKEHNNITDDPESLKLLESGIQDFYINAATRIIKQTPDKVFFNSCPNCNELTRTPYARQCKHCGHSWHDTIAANFKVSKVFSLTQKPNTLFFAGDIKSGTIKKGMKIDLTFLGVALKPKITNVEFIDYISEKKAEVALGVTVEQADDFEYLKNRGVLAIPIIIEQ